VARWSAGFRQAFGQPASTTEGKGADHGNDAARADRLAGGSGAAVLKHPPGTMGAGPWLVHLRPHTYTDAPPPEIEAHAHGPLKKIIANFEGPVRP